MSYYPTSTGSRNNQFRGNWSLPQGGRDTGVVNQPEVPPSPSEISLYQSGEERDHYETLATLFSIIITVERLEKLYVRGLEQEKYSGLCSELIGKYKTAQNLVKGFNLDNFCQQYGIDAPAARHRLKIGYDATLEHKVHQQKTGVERKQVAQAVQYYITCMDNLKLGLVSIDQLFPFMKDLVDCVNSLKTVDFEGRQSVLDWITKLQKKEASYELNEEESRQLLYDLESSYNSFMKVLEES